MLLKQSFFFSYCLFSSTALLAAAPQLKVVAHSLQAPPFVEVKDSYQGNTEFAHEGPVLVENSDSLYFLSNRQQHDNKLSIAMNRLDLSGGHFSKELSVDWSLAPLMPNSLAYSNNSSHTLYLAAQGNHETKAGIYTYDIKTKKTAPIVTAYKQKPFNSINDLIIDKENNLWFTDPSYGFEQGFRDKPQLSPGVYYFNESKQKLSLLDDSILKPNGIAFDRTGHYLYVTDSSYFHGNGQIDPNGQRNLVRFTINRNKNIPLLTQKTIMHRFTTGFPDGVKVDRFNQVWVAYGKGIKIFSEKGKELFDIVLPNTTILNFALDEKEEGITAYLMARYQVVSLHVSSPFKETLQQGRVAFVSKTNGELFLFDINKDSYERYQTSQPTPHETAISPNKNWLVAASPNFNNENENPGNSIDRLNLETNTLDSIILPKAKHLHGLGFVSNKSFLTTSEGSHAIYQVNIKSGAVLQSWDTGQGECHLVTTLPSSFITSCRNEDKVLRLPFERYKPKVTWSLLPNVEPFVVNRANTKLYTGSKDTNMITVFDLEDNKKSNSRSIQSSPIRMRLSPDEQVLLVASYADQSITQVDAKNLKELFQLKLEACHINSLSQVRNHIALVACDEGKLVAYNLLHNTIEFTWYSPVDGLDGLNWF